jgi:hypothetical protein
VWGKRIEEAVLRPLRYAEGFSLISLGLQDLLIAYLCQMPVQVVQLFDSWAHHLSPDQFVEFSLPYANRVAETMRAKHPHVPVIFHANGGEMLKMSERCAVTWPQDVALLPLDSALVVLYPALNACWPAKINKAVFCLLGPNRSNKDSALLILAGQQAFEVE